MQKPRGQQPSEERFFAELNPNPVVVADESLAILYLNPASRLHFPDLEKLGSQHPALQGLTPLREQLKTQREGLTTFVREVEVEGKTFEEQIFALPQKKRIYLYLADVTERHRTAMELKRSEAQLRSTNLKLGELLGLKDQFVSTVSHELRTPLSITKEGISLVLDGVTGAIREDQRRVLTVAHDGINRLARLIDNLLDISKLEAGKVKVKRDPVDLTGLIKQIAALFEPKAREQRLQLLVHVPQERITVDADADMLTQVFTNLVGNALKFTEQGSIELSVREHHTEVECVVTDTGIGIAKEDLPKVFEKFQQFERRAGGGAKGTGLGLAITKKLIELHGGTIRLDSTLGQGTTVTLSLPTSTGEALLHTRLKDGITAAIERGSKLSLILTVLEGSGEALESIVQQLEGVVKTSLRRAGDVALRNAHELVVLLPDCDQASSVVVQDRLERAVEAYLVDKQLADKVRVRWACGTYPDDVPGAKDGMRTPSSREVSDAKENPAG